MQLNKSSDGSEEPLRKRRKMSEKEDDDSSDDSMLNQHNSRNALRFSQVERFLGTASEVESNVLGMSSSDLVWGDQDEDITEAPEMHKKTLMNNRMQERLLQGIDLRSSRDGNPLEMKTEPLSPNGEDAQALAGLGMSALSDSTASGLSLSSLTLPLSNSVDQQQRMLSDLMASDAGNPLRGSSLLQLIKEGLDNDDNPLHSLADSGMLSHTTTNTVTTTTTTTGISSSTLLGKPDLRTPMGGPRSPMAGGTIQLAQPQSSSSLQQGPSPEDMISRLHAMDAQLDNQLKALKFRQRRVLESSMQAIPGQVDELLESQDSISKNLREAIKTLESIYENHVLTSSAGFILISTLDSFKFHMKQLQILQEEINQARQGGPFKPSAALVVSKQPFPCTVKQMKSLDDPVEVKLITGAKVDITGVGVVRAEMINEDYNPVPKKKNTQPSVQNAEEPIKETGVAVFKKLTFPHGSRVKSVNMKFGAEVNLNGVTVRLQSDATRPFIVMTNHGQRSITEGKLLKKSTFFGRSEIPWPLFANTLQLHYLRATGQDPMKPVRPLSLKDVSYLHVTKFGGRSVITQDDYDEFWKWFGKILYKIRNHQKHILPMWLKGLIYGFLSREESDTILKEAKAHSFLIRFSDRRPGHFVVVYVNQIDGDRTEIKHYLVRKEDIDNKTTLPDFLKECENLWYILQLVRDPETGVVSLRYKPKDKALTPFYTRRPTVQLPFGYDNRQP
jgi:hypothetical protein